MTDFSLTCPIPISDYPTIVMAHGGGGRLSQQLLEKIFQPVFKNDLLLKNHDGSVFESKARRFAFSTDSYVVKPLFFPGGDIGSLAVNGTANDLAMCGAHPLYLSCGFIIEEGLPMETLWRIVLSMKRAADAAGVQIITGDTKVVDKGKGDGIFINTSGVGEIESETQLPICPTSLRAGDVVVVSGDIGRHGMTIMSVRESLGFETSLESDCAPLWTPVQALLQSGIEIHCLRDLTRGGLASALNEIATTARLEIQIDESAVPIREDVRGACEILGFDPLYVANEGRFVAFIPADRQHEAIAILRAIPVTADCSVIGTVTSGVPGRVSLKSKIGAARILDMLSGEQLPRIC